eukprot:CAMPEP_0178990516 /NCGR_PEP_ID=MMETSP0795-20121207/4998_1 /TAXON_ID=88552 /ORGANISM="Amoebophrya sp., Strain Ameob2" /LENGTH=88 /DNA_ID=CAMNT_0020682087 /DNA_START=404 /DNA_END=667 /DNA_ORIENTATION=-
MEMRCSDETLSSNFFMYAVLGVFMCSLLVSSSGPSLSSLDSFLPFPEDEDVDPSSFSSPKLTMNMAEYLFSFSRLVFLSFTQESEEPL